MADQIARGEELEKKAEKQLSAWGLFCSKYDDAADLFDRAANAFKLGESCKPVHILESKHEAANAYADAAHCYKKTNTRGSGLFVSESVSFLEQSVNLFLEIVRLNMSAGYYKETWSRLLNINYYEKAAGNNFD